MQYIEALEEYQPGRFPAVFLAGGITGSPDWQEEIVARLRKLPLVLLNPRRANFPIGDPSAASAQITWEHRHLRMADAVVFWFPRETLCPITLYELGTWSVYRDERGPRPLFIGIHPEYQRRQDVEIQTRLARPEVPVVYSVPELAESVSYWLASFKRDK